MATREKTVPRKLKHDAIVEALFEIRFDSTTIPEVLAGRLADHRSWQGFTQRRLPAYEIPAAIRQADPNLRYQPVFELASATGDGSVRTVRVGPHVLSYHRSKPYIGWARFRPELDDMVTGLFEKASDLSVRRLGLRYMNALTPSLHGIRSVLDLDVHVDVAGEAVPGNVNINFTRDVSNETASTVRIATPEFVQGALPPQTSVYVDVDVFTKDAFRTKEPAFVQNWITFAHEKEKVDFFRLLTDSTIETLKES